MKLCNQCYKNKEFSEFYKRVPNSDTLINKCKQCHSKSSKLYREFNKEKIVTKEKEWRLNNKDLISAANKIYRNTNKIKIAINKKQYSNDNKDKIAERDSKYYLRNKTLILEKNKKYREKNKEVIFKYIQKYQTERKKIDINFKLALNLRSRINIIITKNRKVGSVIKDLGCTVVELKVMFENMFYNHPITNEKMLWSNYGLHGWHIDHIVPLSSFDLTNREQFLKACNYTNLQPLWAEDNLKKSNKIL